MKRLLATVFLLTTVTAQTPSPTVSPCDDLRLKMAESLAETAQIKAELKGLRTDELKQENAQQREKLATVSAQLEAVKGEAQVVVRDNQALATSLEQLKLDHEKLLGEKTALEAKIARANRRLNCRVFRIGCIGAR